MKILILGSGAREYSIALALKRCDNEAQFFFANGNGATKKLGTNIKFTDINTLTKFAKNEKIDICIVGSEDFLASGVVDSFQKANLAIFGPTKAAAQLESSKIFMKEFLQRHQIKTANFLNTDDLDKASEFIRSLNLPVVVKADGLCAGKGVIIAQSHQEAINAAEQMLIGQSFGEAGRRVVIEEFLDGFELSIFALCDGTDFVLLPATQDHKKLKDNDKGPNTGGMGAYAPSALADDELLDKIKKDIIIPTLAGMKSEGNEFTGVLFAGIMVVDKTPFVLEFNVRFGDPECEVLMPLLENPLELILACVEKRLSQTQIRIKDEFAVGVVCASENYPYKTSPKAEIFIKEVPPNSHLSFAGVSLEQNKLYASGGRVLVCVGLGKDIKSAKDNAYKLCENVNFQGKQYRSDIAYQALR